MLVSKQNKLTTTLPKNNTSYQKLTRKRRIIISSFFFKQWRKKTGYITCYWWHLRRFGAVLLFSPRGYWMRQIPWLSSARVSWLPDLSSFYCVCFFSAKTWKLPVKTSLLSLRSAVSSLFSISFSKVFLILDNPISVGLSNSISTSINSFMISFISSISYEIFLIHHVIIYSVCAKIASNFSKVTFVLGGVATCLIIIFFSWILNVFVGKIIRNKK